MRILVFSLWFLLVVTSWPIQSADRTAKGAAIGAGVGLVAGKDVRDVAKGGLIGGGAGCADEGQDVDKKKTKKYAKDGAAIGAGVGLVTDGVEGAVKGAIYGGSAGAVYGDQKSKN